MTDYTKCSKEVQEILDEQITLQNIRETSGFTIADVRANVHSGNWCAECWMNWYNCLCSHDDERDSC